MKKQVASMLWGHIFILIIGLGLLQTPAALAVTQQTLISELTYDKNGWIPRNVRRYVQIAKTKLATFEEYKKNPDSQPFPDDVMLAEIYSTTNVLYRADKKYQKTALEVWTKARSLAGKNEQPNVGNKDEILSLYFQLLAKSTSTVYSHLQIKANYNLIPNEIKSARESLQKHEAEFLGGKQSKRGRFLLAEMMKMYNKGGGREKVEARMAAQKRVDNDAQIKELNRLQKSYSWKADALAKKIGFRGSQYQNSGHAVLKEYGEKLIELQKKRAKRERELGLESGQMY